MYAKSSEYPYNEHRPANWPGGVFLVPVLGVLGVEKVCVDTALL